MDGCVAVDAVVRLRAGWIAKVSSWGSFVMLFFPGNRYSVWWFGTSAGEGWMDVY